MSDPRDGRTPRRAVALGYRRSEDPAPRVLARGNGRHAEAMLERAAEQGVPIERDEDLLTCLEPLDVGARIPPERYEAVARILAFVYRLNAGLRTGVDSSQADRAAAAERPRGA